MGRRAPARRRQGLHLTQTWTPRHAFPIVIQGMRFPRSSASGEVARRCLRSEKCQSLLTKVYNGPGLSRSRKVKHSCVDCCDLCAFSVVDFSHYKASTFTRKTEHFTGLPHSFSSNPLRPLTASRSAFFASSSSRLRLNPFRTRIKPPHARSCLLHPHWEAPHTCTGAPQWGSLKI